LAGALKNAGFKIRGEYFRQEREDVELHMSILAVSAGPDKRLASFFGKNFACFVAALPPFL
jgi:hypothetical protein